MKVLKQLDQFFSRITPPSLATFDGIKTQNFSVVQRNLR